MVADMEIAPPKMNRSAAKPGPAAPARSRDPYVGLHFWVEIDGLEIAEFGECSSPTVETEIFEYTEGGLNTYTHKFPVRTKYGNLTLKRGIDEGQDLYRWYSQSILHGKTAKRKNVALKLYTSDRRLVKVYHMVRAFPVKWTGPDMKADAGATAVETLEFAHEGFTITTQ